MTDYHLLRRNELANEGWGFHQVMRGCTCRVFAFRGASFEHFDRPTLFEAWAQALTFAQLQSEVDAIDSAVMFSPLRDTREETPRVAAE